MYEENMHTLYRFNTLSNTRKHVINKKKTHKGALSILKL